MTEEDKKNKPTIAQRFNRAKEHIVACADYCINGIWRDSRNDWRVKLIKIVNLTVRGFMDRDLQSQACALTYRMLLAMVPALALLFAISRGFGLQTMLENEILDYLPSQKTALLAAFKFVDSYLNQASEGIFVGVGIVFLLWTLVSLLGSVEDSMNSIWHVRSGRSYWRKITDYLAIFLILPILMICSAGLSLLMSNTLRTIFDVEFLQPAINWLIDAGSYIFTALFFAGAYSMIPNTKVKFINALICGAVVAAAFQVLQWVFLTGQMYVTKYNAIYGSFSFLPLLLIWLQLVWLITLIGALICYASQNAGNFIYYQDVDKISPGYNREVTLAVMAIVSKRFVQGLEPLTVNELSKQYGIPQSLVIKIVLRLHDVGLITFVASKSEFDRHRLQPGIDVTNLTVGEIVSRLQNRGSSQFIPDFDKNFSAVTKVSDEIVSAMINVADQTNIISLNIKT